MTSTNEVLSAWSAPWADIGRPSRTAVGTTRDPGDRPGDDCSSRSRTTGRWHRAVRFGPVAVVAPMLPRAHSRLLSGQILAFTLLLKQVETVLGFLGGVLVVADALHAEVGHADTCSPRTALI